MADPRLNGHQLNGQKLKGRRMRGGRDGRRSPGISWLNLVAVTLIGTGIVVALIGRSTLRWSPPPLPPAWAAGRPGQSPRDLPGSQSRAAAHRVPAADPASIEIPAIGVSAKIIDRGLNRDGSIAVPPLKTPFVTSWYDRGPSPGESGASVILGHVDAAGIGPAVFYKLGDLRPGNRIYVRLRNGHTAIFETYSVALYLKTRFPTARVYGYTSWPTLRLVTCGGEFDPKTGHYLGNTVAFASYVGERR
jgi:Sortase domain